jgi:hypothetical protein
MRPALRVGRGFPRTVLPTRPVPLALSFRSLLIISSITQHLNRPRSPLHAWSPRRISPVCSSSCQPHTGSSICLADLLSVLYDDSWPGRRTGLRGDTTRAPIQGPRPKGGGTTPPCLVLRDWHESEKSTSSGHGHQALFHAERAHSRLIAHTNPASSRATAVTASAGFFPRLIKRSSRLCSRFCAFHAIAQTCGETPTLRSRNALPIRGGRR